MATEEDYTIEFGKKYLLYTLYVTHQEKPFLFIRNAAGTVLKVFLTDERTHSSDKHLSTCLHTAAAPPNSPQPQLPPAEEPKK